jgi:hypothetical protein
MSKRIVLKCDDNLKPLEEFSSLKDAALSILRHPRGIRLSILKNYKCGGFFWKYKIQENLEDEVWKKHPKYPIYCSSHGRVKRESGIITLGTIMNRSQNYKRVHFAFDRKKYFLVHRLIAESFIPNPENKPVVDHIDFDKSNNHIKNLRWFTHKENSNHRK